MPRVELERSLNVPAVPARSSASHIMHAIAEQRGMWSEFSLYLNFGSLGLPDVGYVAIPVRVEIADEQLEPRHEIRFTVRARRSPEAFPIFIGAIGIDPIGPSDSQIWLAGDYELPASTIGAVVDRVLGQGRAEKALDNMLEELAEAIEANVQKRELDRARYRLVFNTGD
jgi:hypothetical protein